LTKTATCDSDDELAAVLDFHAGHREAPRQRVVAVLRPLDDVDELFLDEIHQSHV
jgi:Holliday junction resolvasome RuvABC ATP-dependent DNA helicase subunit